MGTRSGRSILRAAPGGPLVHCVSWLHANLFSSAGNTLLTFICLWIVYAVFVPAFNWLVVDAFWSGQTPAHCPDVHAACWPFIRARLDQLMYGLYPEPERWRVNLGIALCALLSAPLFIRRVRHKAWLIGVLLLAYPVIGYSLFLGGIFGLNPVATGNWGGFFLTIITAVFVLATSLPLAVLLALGRESSIPLIRIGCATWIEFWRAVPALVVLFVAIIMFPLFMPPGIEVDKLLRALLALTVLMSSYLAEAIRGALQAIPRGQYEAAHALGLNYWQRTFLVILPQAFPIALPQVTSNFIGLFKETTVLLIIGLFDLLGMAQSAASDPAWLSPGVSATAYVFAATFYWVFCFGLSRYSARLEGRARSLQPARP
ncbi:MAG: amino acid ABC transporter permease [Gammaproteobacteria bacterium]|nr:amino acid ABC transporter permease [Gammaproteobacteria bacterium]